MNQKTLKTFQREVVASLSKGGGIDVAIEPPEKIDDVGRGDIVVWNCKNETGQPLTLKIGNFKAAAAFANQDECRDLQPDPFEPGPRHVELPAGGKGVIRCEVLYKAHYPRTYKYDILDGHGKPLLDPEIEIERP